MQIKPDDTIPHFDENLGLYVPLTVLMAFSMVVEDPTCDKRVHFGNYVICTDGKQDEQGCDCIYAYTYDPNQDQPDFLPVETEAEWEKIEQIWEKEYAKVKNMYSYPKDPTPGPDPDLPFS